MLTAKQIIKVLKLEESLRKVREEAALRGEKWAIEEVKREEEERRNEPPEGYW